MFLEPAYLQEEEQPQQVPVASYFSADESTHSNQELNQNINQNPDTEQADSMQFLNIGYDGRPATSYKIPTLFSSKSMSNINQNNNNQPLTQTEIENLQNALNKSQIMEPPRSAPQEQTVTLARPSSTRLLSSLIPKQQPSACGHYNAGQELCYLCHQRSRRNVPVYIHEETRQKELEETQLLMQYQSLKDLDKQLKDEEKRNNQRLDRAKIDAFNLGVSEALKQKKMERPKTSDMSVSYYYLE